ncbi:hypothetical protein [Ornithinibacillus xuwenensis]|jgi:hypothetical protein|uniref:Uncharacterized protein n=1 Tax=Ornithinibacillus xuwenensis TaxID=3144668 RepID=A0ABU9XL20_9BACI
MRIKLSKKLIGFILVLLIIGSGVKVAFADQDIAGMISNWLHNKTEESIEEIDKAITQEQAKQTTRLKEELQAAIQNAEKQFNQFVEREKTNRITELENYTDTLIQSIDIETKSGQAMLQKLNQILDEAKTEMSAVVNDNSANSGEGSSNQNEQGDADAN